MLKPHVIAFASAMLVVWGVPTAWAFANPEIEWEIENRFRFVKEPDVENVLYSLVNMSDDIRGGLRDKETIARFASVAPTSVFAFGTGTMPATFYDSQSGSYGRDYVAAPTSWRFIFRAYNVSEDAHCRWLEADDALVGSGGCTEFRPARPLSAAAGPIRIALEVDGEVRARMQVEPRDILVVAIGDSYASGEGNPDVAANGWSPFSKGEWLDRKCHRSLLSWTALAAAKLAKDDPHRSVTFVSRACSGALATDVYKECETGATTDASGCRIGEAGCQGEAACSQGIEPEVSVGGSKHLAPQIEQLRRDLCVGGVSSAGECNGEVRQPELILLSIGGNDAGFGNLIVKAITSRVAYCENGNHPGEECQSGLAGC